MPTPNHMFDGVFDELRKAANISLSSATKDKHELAAIKELCDFLCIKDLYSFEYVEPEPEPVIEFDGEAQCYYVDQKGLMVFLGREEMIPVCKYHSSNYDEFGMIHGKPIRRKMPPRQAAMECELI